MKKVLVVGLMIAFAVGSYAAELSPGLKALQGKWEGSRTNRQGDRYTFTLEIKDNKLTFEARDPEGETRLFAKGTAKAEKSGPFHVLTLTGISAGRSADALEEVDDTRTSVYVIRDGKLLIASNFDREREGEQPRVDEYSRAANSASASGNANANLAGTWNANVSLSDQTFDYKLRIDKADGDWQTTFVSPRTGEHKAKSTTVYGSSLEIAIDREIQGNNVTFVYKGKLAASKVSGTVTVKGYEDQFAGTWTASR